MPKYVHIKYITGELLFYLLTLRGPCIVIYYNKTNEMHKFLKFIFGIELYMFRTVYLSIIMSLALYTQQYIQVMLSACQRDQDVPWNILIHLASSQRNLYVLLYIQCQIPDDGQRNCPKHVEFFYKNKFQKLVHLVGFIIRMLFQCNSQAAVGVL